MSNSLRDQLVKSGLANAHQAKEVRKEKSRGNKPAKSSRRKDSAPTEAQRAAAEKRERDRALNREREQARQREAAEKDARNRIVDSEIPHDGDIAFNFTHGGRIKKVNVSAEQRAELVAGRIAIARTRGRFRLVPRKIAEQVQPVAPFLIAFLSDGDAAGDPAYEEHPVPDDLMW